MPSTSAAPKPPSPQEMMCTQDLQLQDNALEYDQAGQDQRPGLCSSGTTHGMGGPGIQRRS